MKQFGLHILILVSLGLNAAESQKTELNDVHSQLNATVVSSVHNPKSVAEIQALLRRAKANGQAVSISGGRHSMGGQQFGAGTLHINMSEFNRVVGMDERLGIVEVESGIQWPALISWLQARHPSWSIRQKQTGADRLSIGGALSSNIHGRGLKMRPMIDDVESFTLIDAAGGLKNCSRSENSELFKLAIGGYGLFGVIGTVKVRLMPTTTLQREVKLLEVRDFIPLAEARAKEGYLYGDFQFDIDPSSKKFMNRGIYSLYKPVTASVQIPPDRKELSGEDWTRLIGLAHTDKSKAFDIYSAFYLASNGQHYRSDDHQLGVYIDDYHKQFGDGSPASEMISEIYVPRDKLPELFTALQEKFRQHKVNVVYGTVRLIEADRESFLAWAKKSYAATVFNFHVDHSGPGIEKAKRDFRMIIDEALKRDGSYFLTYHRWATKEQVLRAYPQMPEFLRLKKKYDPEERFQSEWYRHYRDMFKP